MANEFDLIQKYFQPLSTGLSADETGIGDDGAIISTPEDHQLVVVTDTLVRGVHFPDDASAYDIGWKALAVNLSDLAAMGAKPGFFSLALTLPDNDSDWLEGFAKGLSDLASEYAVPLIGGDTTKGPLTVTITANGWVKRQSAVLRSGAKMGDLVYVTNTIGDAALGLKIALKTSSKVYFSEQAENDLLEALNRPIPQLNVSEQLSDYFSSAIDISDGLAADLMHVLESSGKKAGDLLSARINLEEIPLSDSVKTYIENTGDWSAVLSGGDDYQLCFTVSKHHKQDFEKQANSAAIRVTQIGVIQSGRDGVNLFLDSQPFSQEGKKGYLHF